MTDSEKTQLEEIRAWLEVEFTQSWSETKRYRSLDFLVTLADRLEAKVKNQRQIIDTINNTANRYEEYIELLKKKAQVLVEALEVISEYSPAINPHQVARAALELLKKRFK